MLLVVRSAPQLPATLAALHEAGFPDLLPCPISTITHLPVAIPENTTLLLTSANALPPHANLRGHSCYCVGEGTAAAATQAGLNVLGHGPADATALASYITGLNLPPTHFTHLHGTKVHTSWHQQLTQQGHKVTALPTYQTTYIESLPANVTTALPNIHTLLLFSAGGTKHLLNLLARGNMQACLPPHARVVALSPQVAQAALPFNRPVQTCQHPNLPSLIARLRASASSPPTA